MRRFFVVPENISDSEVVIEGAEVNHIRNVLRMARGDEIIVLDGKGHQYKVSLLDFHHNRIVGKVLSQEAFSTESPVEIWMGQGLIKGHRFDKLLRKAVELGVHGIVPLYTERSIPRWSAKDEVRKLERWRQVAVEACKQSGRTRVPEFSHGVQTLDAFLQLSRSFDLVLAFWENESEVHLRDLSPEKEIKRIGFLTGPEGGWAPQEIARMKECGVQTVSLGPRILRAESASLVIISLLQFQWGDL